MVGLECYDARMARVIIIGAGGQIGHDLVPRLHALGHELTLVDRRAAEGSHIQAVLEGLYGEDGWQSHWRVLDATDMDSMASLLREVKPEKVFHLAALLSARCEDDPEACWQVNMASFKNVLDVLDNGDLDRQGMQGLTQSRRGWLLGDVIISIDGNEVSNEDDLVSILEDRQAGDVVKVVSRRENQTREYDVRLLPPN